MKIYQLSFTREQLRQIAEGLGMRIDFMRENSADYSDDEIDAAKVALEHLTEVMARGG